MCTTGGYPISSVKVTGPDSLDLVCPSSVGGVSCTTADDDADYTVSIASFSLGENGVYTCKVETSWQKMSGGTAITNTAQDTVTLEYGLCLSHSPKVHAETTYIKFRNSVIYEFTRYTYRNNRFNKCHLGGWQVTTRRWAVINFPQSVSHHICALMK